VDADVDEQPPEIGWRQRRSGEGLSCSRSEACQKLPGGGGAADALRQPTVGRHRRASSQAARRRQIGPGRTGAVKRLEQQRRERIAANAGGRADWPARWADYPTCVRISTPEREVA